MLDTNNPPVEQTKDARAPVTNTKKSAIKYILIGASVPITCLIIYCCVHFKGGDNNFAIRSSDTVAGINISGAWFLQPVNRPVALKLASVSGEITLNVIDSNYCNIVINRSVGNVVLSRKYNIQKLNLTFNDPMVGKKVTYVIDSLLANTNYFVLRDTSGKELFRVWSYNVAGSKLASENALQRNAFLYPTLSPQEVVDKPYKLKMTGSLYKERPSKVNIDKLF
ncbi:hypothetical protein HDF19_13240 [Mucilaginibacter sp. E4BP6]|uniref:hypothetical protein n=1 Tax=Mucilaginibacter sp. E4BP6 TaxID=2723089 RepID=UPI0015C75A53|nr:hypothetical protein [Mucilaginibacter sp. E4BP6]NYE66057.1 hypothetical protein [Mucilaginibacter sp. E4BP6]